MDPSQSILQAAFNRLLAVTAFLALAVSPVVYHLLPTAAPLRPDKIALIVAYSGPLEARGKDMDAAVNIMLQQINAGATRFQRLHGQAPSDRDIIAALQARAALTGGPAANLENVPAALHQIGPGAYPGPLVGGGAPS